MPLEQFPERELRKELFKIFLSDPPNHCDDDQDEESQFDTSDIVDDVSESASSYGNASSLSFRSNFDTLSKMSPVPSSIMSESSSRFNHEVVNGKQKGLVAINVEAYPQLREKLGDVRLRELGIDDQLKQDFNVDCRFESSIVDGFSLFTIIMAR